MQRLDTNIGQRLILLRQVHESAFNKPNENFTLSIQELDEYKNKLNQHVVSVLRSVQSNPAAAASHLPPGQPQQLNAANLQQQQAVEHRLHQRLPIHRLPLDLSLRRAFPSTMLERTSSLRNS